MEKRQRFDSNAFKLFGVKRYVIIIGVFGNTGI